MKGQNWGFLISIPWSTLILMTLKLHYMFGNNNKRISFEFVHVPNMLPNALQKSTDLLLFDLTVLWALKSTNIIQNTYWKDFRLFSGFDLSHSLNNCDRWKVFKYILKFHHGHGHVTWTPQLKPFQLNDFSNYSFQLYACTYIASSYYDFPCFFLKDSW